MIQASSEVIRYFAEAGYRQVIRKEEMIYLQGDESPRLYLVEKGRVRMFFVGENGREITFQIIGEGQMFGESAFLSHAARSTTICAVTDVVLLSCTVGELSGAWKKSRELTEALLTLFADNYETLCGQVRRLSIYNRFQRVASYLLEQTAQENPGIGIEDNVLPYTQEELGICLNLNRVTVTGVLKVFREKGLVELGRRKIRILNREGLKQLLQSEYP